MYFLKEIVGSFFYESEENWHSTFFPISNPMELPFEDPTPLSYCLPIQTQYFNTKSSINIFPLTKTSVEIEIRTTFSH